MASAMPAAMVGRTVSETTAENIGQTRWAGLHLLLRRYLGLNYGAMFWGAQCFASWPET